MNGGVNRQTLANGLTVLTKEVHRVPLVSIWAWYRVGARNEVPGITGISHWVEHMLFKGTPTFAKGEIFRSVTRAGGTLNGFTWLDFTTYFETVPAERSDLGLRIEADRMVNSVFDPEEVQSERSVIISEREGNENSPSFLLSEEIAAAAFKIHPYGQGVIGYKSDLRAMTRDDLYNYYRTYYMPNNAILVAVGDFETDRLLAKIDELFGPIPAAPWIPPVRPVEPPQLGQRRVTVRHPGGNEYIEICFHVPEAASEDAYPLIVLDAVLSGGKSMAISGGGSGRMGRSSRLYRRLVEGELAASATSSFNLTKDPYLFSVWAILRPNVKLGQVEQNALQEVQRLREEEVGSEELVRALKQVKAQFVYGAESVTDQAYWLGSLETIGLHETVETFLDKILRVSTADVKRVANDYLSEANSTVGWFVPSDGRSAEDAGAAGASTGSPNAMFFVPASPEPSFPQNPKVSVHIDRHSLDSGLVVLGHEDHDSPQVVMRVHIRAGSMMEPDQEQGLARFTASTLLRGTTHRTFQQLNEETDSAGIGLSIDSAWQGVQLSAKCLREDFDHLVEIIADLVQNPTFPEDEMEKVRGQMATTLREQVNDTRTVAERQFRELIYPEGHPYRRWPAGREEVISRLRRDDLVNFYRRCYRPEVTTIVVVGDVPFETAKAKTGLAFGSWTVPGQQPAVELSPMAPIVGIERRVVPVPGKTQADLALGRPALARKDPDFYALSMANLILGRLGLGGRLGAKVRDELGLAYSVNSDLEAGLLTAPWSIHAGVNPANVSLAIDTILGEINRFRNELVGDEELSDAKNFLTGILPLSLETNEGVARLLVDIELYGLGLDYIERYPQIVNALTKEQIRDAGQRYFTADNLGLVIAGPPGL